MKKLILTTLALCFILPHFAHADITSNLFGYWKLNEGTGSTAADSSGNSNTGTLNNGPTWDIGGLVSSTVLKFVNANQNYVGTANYQTLDNSFTWAAWVKPTGFSGNPGAIISLSSGAYLGTDNTGDIIFSDPSGATQDTLTTLSTSAWTHLAVVCIYSGGSTDEVHIYANGTEIYANTGLVGNCDMNLSASTIVIGQYGPNPNISDGYDGYMQEVRVYNRALTSSDITELYNYPAPDITSNLLGWWKFDEGSGTTAADSSGNSNTGTLGGTTVPSWTTGKIGPYAINNTVATGGNGGHVTTINNVNGTHKNETYTAWLYPTDLTGQSGHNIFMITDDLWIEILTNGELNFHGRDNLDYTYTGATIPLNSWTHVAVTCNDSNGGNGGYNFYINGAWVYRGSVGTACYNNVPSTVTIGSYCSGGSCNNSYGFTGYIDDARYYLRELRPADITAVYNYAPAPPSPSSPARDYIRSFFGWWD